MNNKPNTDLESQNEEEEHNEQRAPITREDSGDTERPPPSNQQTATVEKEPRTNTNDNDEQEQEEEDDSDPSEPVKPLDWSKLEQQYHASMKQCSQDEAALMQEWSELMNVRALLPSTPTHLPLQY